MRHGNDRRDFLRLTMLAAGGAGLQSLAAGSRAAQTPSQTRAPLYKISLAQWSLHRALQSRQIDHFDFIRQARVDFGLDGVEYVNSFFKDKARDQAYLGEMNKRAADHNLTQVLIMIDGEGALGDPDEARRKQAVENHYRWVEAAKTLGCHSIRVNAQSRGSYDEQLKLSADGLARLTDFASRQAINVIVENHGGLSSNGQWLSAVIRQVNHPRCGTLPDFGNFNLGGGQTYDRYQGVRELMPFAKAVSAKSHDFDAEGRETMTDYWKMMRIVLDAGYHGFVGIEYEGDRLSEPDGIRATKKLLERVRADLAAKK
jgi:sugar phosphate isomerase/epimerase